MAAAMTDDTIFEVETKAVTQDLAETINRMNLSGWEHYQTVSGSLDGDRWAPVGFTLLFRRPLGGVRKKPAAEPAQAGKGGRR
jgi:hypothetical protein